MHCLGLLILHVMLTNLTSEAENKFEAHNNLQRELPSSRAEAAVQLAEWLCSGMSLSMQSPSLLDKSTETSLLPLSELSLKERKPALLSQGTLEGPVFLLFVENH
jgi:hypothetical protein